METNKQDPERLNKILNRALKTEEEFMILIETYLVQNNILYGDDVIFEKSKSGE